jgi:ADP-heptose:LPS heptosyltransferase
VNSKNNYLQIISSELERANSQRPIGILKKNSIKIKFIKINKKKNLIKKKKKILIIRLGGIGDVVMSIPSIKGLKSKYLSSHITFLTYNYNCIFLKKLKIINQVYSIEEFIIKKKFIDKKFDLVINLDNSLISSTVTKLVIGLEKRGFVLRKKNIFETTTKGALLLNKLYTNKNFRRRNKKHISKIFCRIAGVKYIHFDNKKDFKNLHFYKNEKLKLLFRQLKKNNNKIVAVHPGSNWKSKILNFKFYANIINSLIKKNVKIILLGGQLEQNIEKKIFKLIINKKNYINLVNKYNLDKLILILKNCNLLISNDTGTMHFTYLSNTKSINFFGPTSPLESGSMSKSSINIKSSNKSAPCFSSRCKCFKNFSKKCIDGIDEDKVIKLICKKI